MPIRRIVLVVLLAASILGMSAAPSDAGSMSRRKRDRVFHTVNQIRRHHDMARFRIDRGLSRFARRHSRQMARAGWLYHTSSLSSHLSARVSAWGENVGYAGTVRRVVRMFMRSAPHRANILNSRYRRVGIGCVKARGWWWVTMDFYG
jgi:uncharacterized protein YkwD